MKINNKLLLGILALSVAATSCSSDEPVNTASNNDVFGDTPIVLDSYLKRTVLARDGEDTASDATSLTALKTSGFGVFAYYTGTTAWSSFTSTGASYFMENQAVTYSNNAWTYTPTKYWPKNTSDMISFFAYAPYASGTALTNGALSYSGGYDLLAASATDQKKSTNNGTVKLTFAHKTARLAVNVKTTANASAATFKVKDVKIGGNAYFLTGNYNLLTGTWTTESNADATESIFGLGSDYTVTTTAASIMGTTNPYKYIVPAVSEYAAGNIQITITYSETIGGVAYSDVTYTADLGKLLEAGKSYTVTFSIGLDEIKFDADVTNWSEVTDTVNL
jgi:hypothetical protein